MKKLNKFLAGIMSILIAAANTGIYTSAAEKEILDYKDETQPLILLSATGLKITANQTALRTVQNFKILRMSKVMNSLLKTAAMFHGQLQEKIFTIRAQAARSCP